MHNELPPLPPPSQHEVHVTTIEGFGHRYKNAVWGFASPDVIFVKADGEEIMYPIAQVRRWVVR